MHRHFFPPLACYQQLTLFLHKIVYRWKSQKLTQGRNLADIYGKTPTALINAMLIT